MYEPIIDALRRGAADEALTAARGAVAEHADDPAAHRWLAYARRLADDREGALEAIDAAIRLAPENADLHLDRAGLLLQERKLDEAQAALARSTGLDPNQFPAYVVQAQLALGRGDLDEAQRLTRTAARIVDQHPQIAALEGNLAMRRGDADQALAGLSAAAKRWPDEPTLRHALGFAYLAKGHLAFAEQAFRGLLDATPDSLPLRALIADLLRRQGRPGDAADEIAPLLTGDGVAPALRRMVAELELEAGRDESARDRLRELVKANPEDRRSIVALAEAWRRLGAADEARETLDALLEAAPGNIDLWRARLLFEEFASAEALAVVNRWQQLDPDSVSALEARITLHDVAGETEQGDALAARIIELEPGHAKAQTRIFERLLQSDPDAAITHVEGLLARAPDETARRNLRQLLGRCFDAAGQPAAAVATWAELHSEVATQRLPLLEPSIARDWPADDSEEVSRHSGLLLWGAPGSLIERVAGTLHAAGAPLFADRFGPTPPNDLFQRFATVNSLASGAADPAALIAEWRAALPSRGIKPDQICDWLLWWDNTLVPTLREHVPEAMLLVALRDPRDMLLDWIAHGAPAPFALESPEVGARWLAKVLDQVAELHEHHLIAHRLLRMDGVENDMAALAQMLANALDVSLPAVAPGRFGPDRMAAGRWREFVEPLGDAFALLTPVAVRLGYPQD
ncbi:tetratricopeptide repeat protein [Novilysobacter antarcticus]|uniref:tetratricopeptide repeat protein n=1 Tax=Novilysobacter antarcticus TaxID=2862543 RepID=UPI001C9A13F6|nr:tetratricopeptide repeat protein [Lysobacter antarcticus]